LGARIEGLYGRPMDVEWAMRAGSISILQARPITALPEPRASLDWSLPRAGGRYARSSVIELLPDPLSPLFATLALPLWNDAMADLVRSMGLARLMGENYGLLTINDYAYYEFDMSGSQAAAVLIALPVLVPRIVRLLGRAQARWEDEARPRYAKVVS